MAMKYPHPLVQVAVWQALRDGTWWRELQKIQERKLEK